VPAELIEKIRKAASTSPFASGKKNWELIVVTDPEILGRMAGAVEARVAEIGERIRPDMKGHLVSYAKNFTFFAQAPAVFVPTFRAARSLSLMLPGPDDGIAQWERDTYVKSISCVATLVLLAAESLGLGACYVTGALVAEKELGRLLRLPPERSIGALLPVGYKFPNP
jgi:nitroreductase